MRDTTPDRRPSTRTPALGDRALSRRAAREPDAGAPTDAVASLVAHAVALVRDAQASDARANGRPAAGPGRSSPALSRVLGQMRTSVTSYVGDRREEGAPLERVLPEVLHLAGDVAPAADAHDPSGPVVAQVVRWTIEAYYDEPALAHVPRFY